MKESKIKDILDKYYSISPKTCTEEESEFVRLFELDLAKSIISELGFVSSKKIGKILVAHTEG